MNGLVIYQVASSLLCTLCINLFNLYDDFFYESDKIRFSLNDDNCSDDDGWMDNGFQDRC